MPKPLEILLPPSGKGTGVLVLHPWWGLNDTIRNYGAALAAEGFAVGLTDLYDGEIATTIAEAQALRRANQGKPHKDRVRRNLAELLAQPSVTSEGVGLVGFSMGGFLAFGMAFSGRTTLAVACRERRKSVAQLQARNVAAGHNRSWHRHPRTRLPAKSVRSGCNSAHHSNSRLSKNAFDHIRVSVEARNQPPFLPA